MNHKILIIAGSDSCAGAGVQADLKTATSLGVYAATVITCLTAQNTVEVSDILYAPASFVAKQISAVLDDLKITAIKIGMLGNHEIALTVAKTLALKAKTIPIILDPVMVATSGDQLLTKQAIATLKTELIPLSYLVTPNIPEAELLSGVKINNLADMEVAANKILDLGAKNVLVKGGHLDLFDNSKIYNLLLSKNGKKKIFTNKKLVVGPVHGTGCTLASAITCFFAKTQNLELAISSSNRLVYRAIKNGAKIGKGSRILNHFLTNKNSRLD